MKLFCVVKFLIFLYNCQTCLYHKIVLVQDLSTFVDDDKDTLVFSMDAKTPWSKTMRPYGPEARAVMTSFLWSLPRHPILELVLKLQVEHVHRRYYGNDAIDVTGPYVFIKPCTRTKASTSLGEILKR